MSEQPTSDRTSVTISKRVNQSLSLLCAYVGVSKKDMLEMMILDWLKKHGREDLLPKEEEE